MELTEYSKIGVFRQRPKQLEKLGLAVCEINVRRYKTLPVTMKPKHLRNSILKSAQTFNELNSANS